MRDPEVKNVVGPPKAAIAKLMMCMSPGDFVRVSVRYEDEDRYYLEQSLVENFHYTVMTICIRLPQRRYKHKRHRGEGPPAILIARLEDGADGVRFWCGEGHKLKAQ